MTALPEGTRIEDYTLSHVLGEGGFGVTYLAVDEKIGVQFAIKEYFPQAWANRNVTDSTSVTPNSASKGDYAWGLNRFIDEAKTLGRFRHPSIVRVNRVIETNGTAYMVLDYEDGQSFGVWLDSLDGPPTQGDLDAILKPLLDALMLVHSNGILHRDIAPDNIMIRNDGSPVLLDFGSARDAIGKQSKTISSIIKSGYSPVEQYTTDIEDQGPWTDIYALGATLYKAVTGTKPPESTRRITRDRMVPSVRKAQGQYRHEFLAAIDHALALNYQDRPHTIEEWRAELFSEEGTRIAPAALEDLPETPAPLPPEEPKLVGRIMKMMPGLVSAKGIAIAACVLLLLSGGGYVVNTAFTPETPEQAAARKAEEAKRAQAEAAERKADEDAWRRAQSLNTLAGYRTYLDQRPRGRFASQARDKIDELEEAAREARRLAEEKERREEAARQQAEAEAKRRAEEEKRKAEEAARQRAAETAPGREFKDCDDCPTLVVVPAGSFQMGSPNNETARDNDEGPQRTIRIAANLAFGKYEVTRDQFEAFVRDSGHNPGNTCATLENGQDQERTNRSFRNPGFTQQGNHPAACINWNDAQAYVRWLSQKTGKTYRLPSEAEWEYAARAGSTTAYSFGNDVAQLCNFGNGADQTVRSLQGTQNWATLSCNDRFATTAPVGSYTANRFGLHDMHGNLWEWVGDCYNANYNGAPANQTAWTAGDCNQRMARGGSWNSSAKSLRSANRIRANIGFRNRANGFRVVREF